MRCTAAFLMVLTLSGVTVAAEYTSSWILVRLQQPLPGSGRDQGLSLTSGLPRLDAAIAESGVHRIDHALRVSVQRSKDPKTLRRHGLDRTYRFHVPEGSDVGTLVEKFSRLPGVEYAEPDYYLKRHGTIPDPDDPLYPQQWNLHQDSNRDVDAPEAWGITLGEEQVIIAVVDTGVDSDHEDLTGKLVAGYNFFDPGTYPEDGHGHGTAVSSVAAAETNNSVGMAGVCRGCRIMPLRADVASQFADALVWAADQGARVVNISYGFLHSATLLAGVGYAYDAGLVVAVSNGNADATPILYPARYLETIAVGGTNARDERASPFCYDPSSGSSYGPAIDVVAPGDLVTCAVIGSYSEACGTSFAAPHVAGLAGLIHSLDPSAGREEVRHLVRSGAEDQVGHPLEDVAGFDPYYGWGRINLHRTLEATAASMTLRVEGSQATRVYFDTANPLAVSYDFIRGDLGSLSETFAGVELGDVTCLENDSLDADTAGNEDTAVPASGEAFIYLARFNAEPGAGSYGGSSLNRDRRVEPVWPSLAWSTQGDQAKAWHGIAVALDGDVNDDPFDDVIVGADHHDDAFQDEGAVYLYLGSPSGPSPTADWIVHGGLVGERLGRAVAFAGDVNGDGHDDILIGAPYHDGAAGSDVGRAMLYLGSESVPGSTPAWEIEGTQQGAWLGYRVASAGDVNGDGYDDVIIGEPDYDTAGGSLTDSGRAHVYFGSPAGLEPTPWTAETPQADARFGGGVAGVGDVNGDGWDDVAIGADRYDGGQTDEGRVFVYYGSPTGLGSSPSAILEIDNAGAFFGRAVEPAGDVNGDTHADVAVGARSYSNGEEDEGGVFVFLGSAAGIETANPWSYESNQENPRLGISVRTAGDLNDDGYDDLAVGADKYDSTRTDEGRVLVFLGSPGGLSPSPDWYFETGQADARLGWRAAGAGNVNGDRYDDLIVAAWSHDAVEVNQGAAYVFHGPLVPPSSSDCD